MKLTKKLLSFAVCLSAMMLFTLCVSFAAPAVSVTGSSIGAASEDSRTAVFTLDRSDVSSAKLEYTIGGDVYSTGHSSISGNQITFSVDSSLAGNYQLNLLHLTFSDNSASSVEVSGSFSVAASESELSALEGAVSSKSRSIVGSSGKKVVVIDAGHDSTHAGATRAGLNEEYLTYKIAMATYNELRTYQNVDVYLTRSSTSCPLPGSTLANCLLYRAGVSKNVGADLFVSIHINSTGASSQTSSSGACVYISNHSKYTSSSKVLTNHILSELSSRVGLSTSGAYLNADDGTYGYYDDGRLKDDLSVIRNNVLYGVEPVLIEHAFINNPNDRAILSSDSNLTKMGIANASGIAKYLGLSKAGSWSITGLNAGVSNGKVTLNPVISGSTSGLTYKYVYNKYNSSTGKYDWKKWGVIRDFSSAASHTWTAPEDGKYEIYVDVKDSSGTTKSFTKVVEVLPAAFTFNGVNANSVALGNSITISPNISGSTAGLKYKFVWSYNNWSKWGVIKDFSTTSSVSFKPTLAGKYDFYVDVMFPSGSTYTRSKSVTVTMPALNYTGVSVSSTTAYIGDTITITPNLNTSIAGLQYKYVWSYNNWNKWNVIRNYSAAQSVTFKLDYAGVYEFYVDVYSPDGKTTTKTARVNVLNEPNIGYSGVSVPSGAKVGDTISISPNISSNTAGMKYKFVWSYNNWSDWNVIQSFSSSNTADFVIRRPGKYDFYVDVQLPSGTVVTRNAGTAAVLGWQPTGITLSSDSVKPNTPINITGSASASSGLTYKFVWSRNNWSDWNVIQQFSSSNTATFTPAKAGNYEIYMDVQDSYGNVSTIKKAFTVQ